MAEDVLAKISPPEVAAFYRRLAEGVDARKGALKVSLAAALMRKWLDNRDRSAKLVIDAPEHLRNHEKTRATLAYHRQVFLTEKKARRSAGETWAGVLPRLKGMAPHAKWDPRQSLRIEYESLLEFPLRYQLTGNDADRDLLYSVHGCQLHSTVTLFGQPGSKNGRLKISFQAFETYVLDRYDWDYSEHLTVPNPDFGSTAKGAVAPRLETVVVYHKNAKRLEDAGLAAPYSFKTTPWSVTDAALNAPAEVDASRPL
jgi:hypothetical protein